MRRYKKGPPLPLPKNKKKRKQQQKRKFYKGTKQLPARERRLTIACSPTEVMLRILKQAFPGLERVRIVSYTCILAVFQSSDDVRKATKMGRVKLFPKTANTQIQVFSKFTDSDKAKATPEDNAVFRVVSTVHVFLNAIRLALQQKVQVIKLFYHQRGFLIDVYCDEDATFLRKLKTFTLFGTEATIDTYSQWVYWQHNLDVEVGTFRAVQTAVYAARAAKVGTTPAIAASAAQPSKNKEEKPQAEDIDETSIPASGAVAAIPID